MESQPQNPEFKTPIDIFYPLENIFIQVQSENHKINFLISQQKYKLWVLKRTVSMRCFF